MSRKVFTEKELIAIRANPNVEKATERSIKYTTAFQEKAYSESLEGKPIMEIFRDSGFDVTVLGIYRINGFKAKLMKKAERESGFEDLRRGNYRRPAKTGNEATEQRIKRLEHELAYTRQEVEFLKNSGGKYGGSETMGIRTSAAERFEMINRAIQHDANELSISSLCKIAGVSRSGYYAWIKAAAGRQKREEQDRADFALILQAYNYRGYQKGARSIYMRLLHQDPPVIMNIKKIRRLMNKYELVCPIRKENPYRQMAKTLRTDHISKNLINREFKKYCPREALLTDITYLFYKEGVCYLSPIMDVCTHEILAYELIENLKVDFVLKMMDEAIKKYGAELDDEVIVHSDQGCHYTSKAFIEKLRETGFIQSMSRKGNCWDNSLQESFFGHMKDEIADTIAESDTFVEVKRIVDDWLDYYRNDRYHWDLQMLSPHEYYQYLITGVYPLKKGVSKDPASRGSASVLEV